MSLKNILRDQNKASSLNLIICMVYSCNYMYLKYCEEKNNHEYTLSLPLFAHLINIRINRETSNFHLLIETYFFAVSCH